MKEQQDQSLAKQYNYKRIILEGCLEELMITPVNSQGQVDYPFIDHQQGTTAA